MRPSATAASTAGMSLLIVARDEHIVSCEHRQHRGLAVRVLLHRVHREVVRDDNAIKAQRLPQHLMHGGERDAGSAASMHSTTLWLTSTNGAPAAMPASKGRKSLSSKVSYGRLSMATPVCVSALFP